MPKSLGNQKRIQCDVIPLEAGLEFFDPLEEPDFRIIEVVSEVAKSLGINKYNGLFVLTQQPENKVGAEAGFGKKTDALVGTVVTQEVEFRFFENAFGLCLAKRFEVVHELFLSFVEVCRHDLHQCLLWPDMTEMNQRLVEMMFGPEDVQLLK